MMTIANAIGVSASCSQVHREEGGEQGILPRAPQNFKRPCEAFISMIFTFNHFPLHGPDSVREHEYNNE